MNPRDLWRSAFVALGIVLAAQSARAGEPDSTSGAGPARRPRAVAPT